MFSGVLVKNIDIVGCAVALSESKLSFSLERQFFVVERIS